MDERQQQILRTYDEFKELGVVVADDDTPIDLQTVEQRLREKVAEFEQNIDTAHETGSLRSNRMTKAAMLAVMIEGGSDEELRLFLSDRKLSPRTPLKYRREEAIRAILTTEEAAQKATMNAHSRSELAVDEHTYRSVDDTLVTLLNNDDLTPAQQGALRLLFGIVSLPDNDARIRKVGSQMKANAASDLRAAVEARSQALASSRRVAEGERILRMVMQRNRHGDYPTLSAVAQTVAHDKESRAKVPYSDDEQYNLRLVETYVSSALTAMYPGHEA